MKTIATVRLQQDEASKRCGLVHLRVLLGLDVVEDVLLSDGVDLVHRADVLLEARGYHRLTGYLADYDGQRAVVVYYAEERAAS